MTKFCSLSIASSITYTQTQCLIECFDSSLIAMLDFVYIYIRVYCVAQRRTLSRNRRRTALSAPLRIMLKLFYFFSVNHIYILFFSFSYEFVIWAPFRHISTVFVRPIFLFSSLPTKTISGKRAPKFLN